MSRSIGLTQGAITIVDEDDFERLVKHRWYAHWHPHTGSFYARRNLPKENGKQTGQHMAREILGLKRSDPRQADHINRDTLDNRKKNLRIVTHRENQENMRNQSKYGVGVYKCRKRFYAQAEVDGRRAYLGMFDTPEEASVARKRFLGRTLTNLLLIPVGFAIGFSICTCVSTLAPSKHRHMMIYPENCVECDAAKERIGCCEKGASPWKK